MSRVSRLNERLKGATERAMCVLYLHDFDFAPRSKLDRLVHPGDIGTTSPESHVLCERPFRRPLR